jgi:ATP-binding cassette subfamily B protein
VNKIKEAIATMFLAGRYSFAFCWRNNKKETSLRIIISVASTLISYLLVQVTGRILNFVQQTQSRENIRISSVEELIMSDLFWLVIILVVISLSMVVLGRLHSFYRSKWSQTLYFANQRELNNHRATLDVARFRSKEYDDLERRISELPSGWSMRVSFSEDILDLFTSIVSFVFFGASLVWYQPIYALILLVMAIPMVVMQFKRVIMWWNLSQELVPVHKRRYLLERPYRSTSAFVQALMFNQMPALRKEIDINVGNVLEANNRLRRINTSQGILTGLLLTAGLCTVVVHAIWQTVTQVWEVGTLTVIIAAARTFSNDLQSIVQSIADQWNCAKGIILIEKDFLGMKPVIKTEYPVVPRFDITPTLKFDHVSFAYPNTDNLVLQDISFTIEPGSKVAIVGKSGNGKSTIQALLMRYYDPTKGTVYAEDINLRNIEPSVWSKVASALTQEYTVLERLVGEEIASSRLSEPMDLTLVKASAEFSCFDEVVATDPKGYESQIGTEFGGRDFSGGERQRLALARVHYRGTPILILDEPDAQLDPESAEKILSHVFALKGVTVIIITHHVSRAERCDKVIVMGKGKIAEQGTHQELLAKGGIYVSLRELDKKRLGSSPEDIL